MASKRRRASPARTEAAAPPGAADPAAQETEPAPAELAPDQAEGPGDGGPRSVAETFPVVAIGASAGGIEAFTRLFENLPSDTGMAYVVITHLDPTHESALSSLLARTTRMEVQQVEDETRIRRNRVYVIPPNKTMAIQEGALTLAARVAGAGVPMPIDSFMRSLASERRDLAIGVVLSGNAHDGTLGLEAIKAEGGITFCQDEASSRYAGMPRSAMASGNVDFVLPPERIAAELVRMGKHPYVRRVDTIEREGDLAQIFALLRSQMRVEFSHYKQNTLRRRIARRMALLRIDTLESYLAVLKSKPTEVEALYQDLLIKVDGITGTLDTGDFV